MIKYSFITFTFGNTRLNNLEMTLMCAQMHRDPDFEYIVVEHGERYSEAMAKKYGFKYYNAGLNIEMSRASIRNYGALKSTGEFIVLHDNDLLFDETFFKSIKNASEKFRFFYNFKKVIYLNPEVTNKVRKNVVHYAFGAKVEPHDLANCRSAECAYIGFGGGPQGGSFTVRKDDFMSIGGFDTVYKGWGLEDCDFRLRMLACVGYADYGIINLKLYHSWHRRFEDKVVENEAIFYSRVEKYKLLIK